MPRVRRPLLALVTLVLALGVGYGVRAADSHHRSPTRTPSTSAGVTTPSSAPPTTGAPSTTLSSLPPQAAQTVALIEHGGPFPFPHNDGVVFHNDEHRLPKQADGFYREYTVPTPGASTRGTRRIITGGRSFYYTGDHYETFVLIDVTR